MNTLTLHNNAVSKILLVSYFADEKSEAQIGEETGSGYTASKSFQDQMVRKQLNQVWNLDWPGSPSLFLLLCFLEAS